MKINWKINYKEQTAESTNIKVQIIEVENFESTKINMIQDFEGTKVSIGFRKIESGRFFWCKITEILSDILIENKKNDNKLLPYYASQLGDIFSEETFDLKSN